MSTLSEQICEACRVDAPCVSADEAQQLLAELDGWKIVESQDVSQLTVSQLTVSQLTKCYSFDDFISALSFTQVVGELAERVGHHPALLTEWGRVTVRWWTHKISGLHKNDFILAAKTDEVFERYV